LNLALLKAPPFFVVVESRGWVDEEGKQFLALALLHLTRICFYCFI